MDENLVGEDATSISGYAHSYILLIMGMSRNMKRRIALFLICMSIIFGWPNRIMENFISWWDMATIVFHRMIIRMW